MLDLRKAVSFYHGTLTYNYFHFFATSHQETCILRPYILYIPERWLPFHVIKPEEIKSLGNLGYHEFIIGSDNLLIKATLMDRKFVSQNLTLRRRLVNLKMKVGLANLSHSLCRVGSPNLGFLKKPTCILFSPNPQLFYPPEMDDDYTSITWA